MSDNENSSTTTLGSLVGSSDEENFMEFNMSEIQSLLYQLQVDIPQDLSAAESLQQKALRAADIVSEYLGKMVKSLSYLENKINSEKNKAALNYKADDGRTTVEMKKWAGECAPEVEKLQARLAKAKAGKIVLEKKYDILIKSHHHYKEIAMGLKKTILNFNSFNPSNFGE